MSLGDVCGVPARRDAGPQQSGVIIDRWTSALHEHGHSERELLAASASEMWNQSLATK